jgi:hypothetical protein
MAWNIEGLYQRLFDSEFRRYVSNFDILGFSETWATKDPPDIEGFGLIHHKKAKKRLNTQFGRASGGLAVYAANSIANTVNKICPSSNCDNILWVKIVLNVNDSFATAFVYNPPSESAYANSKFFEQLNGQLWEIRDLPNPPSHFLAMGDFNARTANLDDRVDIGRGYAPGEEFLDIEEPKARNNLDTNINDHGRNLIEFCHGSHMRILNGRSGDDLGRVSDHINTSTEDG